VVSSHNNILGRYWKKSSECENYYPFSVVVLLRPFSVAELLRRMKRMNRSFCLKLSAPPCLLSQTAKGVTQARVFVTKNGCFGMWPKH